MQSVEFNARDQVARARSKRDSGSLWYRQLSHSYDSNALSKSVDFKRVPFDAAAECTVRHEGTQMINAILPVNIDTLFETLNSDSRFLHEFNDSRKIFDVVHTYWQDDETDGGRRTRSFKYKMTLKQSLGPKYSVVSAICNRFS